MLLSPLSQVQQRWLEEFLVDGDPKLAALRAGISPKSAASVGLRYFSHQNVQAHRISRQTALVQPFSGTRQDVVAGLKESFQLASIQGDSASMLAAAKAMAELAGLTQGSQKNGGSLKSKSITQMTDAELVALMVPAQQK